MRLPFTPNHVRLVQACYPPPSALLAPGPLHGPNSQELSRLTYYASNRPGKLTKLGQELEKRCRLEANRARSGNAKARASLLITLTIFKALVAECRSDLSLLTPALISTVVTAMTCFPRDLEVTAKAASVFTAWTTYTDGQLIGVDASVTSAYMTALQCFSTTSRVATEKGDGETQNRQRLVGIAAMTGTVTSDALYHSTAEFPRQVSTIIPGLLMTLCEADMDVVKVEAAIIKHQPSASSAYLSEFRPRPLAERRAASIHIHVDGEQGPSCSDVVNASLRAYHSLLERANAHQVSTILEAVFESANQEQWWINQDFCHWFVQTTTDWTQYQYRYAVPKKLVDRLVTLQDAPAPTPMHFALTRMINTVFTSPTPLVNLSTSGIISHLLSLLIRRTSINSMDKLLEPLVHCIAALGTHVYYQDQIYDLAEEVVGRLVSVQVNGLLGRGRSGTEQGREQGMRCILAALRGLLRTADRQECAAVPSPSTVSGINKTEMLSSSPGQDTLSGSDADATPGNGVANVPSRRTRVSPEIWHDSLALLCEADFGVRADYARALVRFICIEVSEEPFAMRIDSEVADGGEKRSAGKAPSTLSSRRATPGIIIADPTSRFLNALHASVFTLATSSSLGLTSSPTGSTHSSSQQLSSPPILNVVSATPNGTPSATERPEASVVAELCLESPTQSQFEQGPSMQPSKSRHSTSLNAPRTRKLSVPLSLLDPGSSSGCLPAATPSDYTHILQILTCVHERLPGRALLTGVPMLLALQNIIYLQQNDNTDEHANEKRHAVRELLARVWAVIGRVWECEEISAAAQKALSSLGSTPILPSLTPTPPDLLQSSEEPSDWSTVPKCLKDDATKPHQLIDAELVLQALAANYNAQVVTGLDRQALLRRLALEWTLESALRDSVERQSTHDILRGDGVSPFLKISPALMHIENLSLQSLARTQHGVGVHDLREALEGRGSVSNLALNSARPSSVRTLDHPTTSSIHSKDRPELTRWRSQSRTVKGSPNDVRDVLNKLGVGKNNGSSLLKASFPALQRTEARYALHAYSNGCC
ncbi:hypothetical protein JB92DRAFT_2904721 [Gautieria morchelliformis]|nr:hypothetical protein JB92DRAFT_2904721 [Gautieria morchelliformis]